MESTGTGMAEPSHSPPKSASAPAKVVIVDIGERQSAEDVKSLRNGKGKLIDHVERIVADLAAAGTISGAAQPVVFVVREPAPVDDDVDDEDDL